MSRQFLSFFLSYLKNARIDLQSFKSTSLAFRSRVIRDAVVSFQSFTKTPSDAVKRPMGTRDDIETRFYQDLDAASYNDRIQSMRHVQCVEQVQNVNQLQKNIIHHSAEQLQSGMHIQGMNFPHGTIESQSPLLPHEVNQQSHIYNHQLEYTQYGRSYLDATTYKLLAEISNLNTSQLKRILSRGRAQSRDRRPKSKITLKDKKILKEWLLEHNLSIGKNDSPKKKCNANISSNAIQQSQMPLQDKLDSLPSYSILGHTSTKSITLTPSQEQELIEKTRLNMSQLRRQLQLLQEERGKLTYESKQFVLQWLNTHKRPPSHQERIWMKEMTKWSSSQLNSFCHYYLQVKKPVDEGIKNQVKEWLQTHRRMPTFSEKLEFVEQFGLSQYQVRNLFRNSYESMNINNANSLLSEYMCQRDSTTNNSIYHSDLTTTNDSSNPENLWNMTGKLENIDSVQTNDGEITPAHLENDKSALIEWYNLHKRMPNKEEKEQLANISNRSAKSVYNFIYRLQQSKPQIITQRSKDIIRSWLIRNNRLPGRDERQELLLQTNLSQHQLENQLYSIFKRLKSK